MNENIALFVKLLEEKYGPWNRNKAQFGTTSYGKIAKDLSISSSQFSKLLYGNATEGMYDRTLENINRLIERENLEKSFAINQKKLTQKKHEYLKKLYLFSAFAFFVGAIISLGFFYKNDAVENVESHPLEEYFTIESEEFFDSPYLNENDITEFCACSGFEGKWEMSEPFKLPLPGMKKPGLFYKAKSADLKLRCTNLLDPYVEQGNAMIGFEHLKSEIWIDIEQKSLVPRFFNVDTKKFTEEFDQIKFEKLKNFKKVADLSAFNVNIFEIKGDSIVRKAELSGRMAIEINEELVNEYNIDINHITKNVLGDLTKTNCKVAYNKYCNPNDLSEGSTISFNCTYTIGEENLGLKGGYPYKKGYEFKEQVYSDYIACDCPNDSENQ